MDQQGKNNNLFKLVIIFLFIEVISLPLITIMNLFNI